MTTRTLRANILIFLVILVIYFVLRGWFFYTNVRNDHFSWSEISTAFQLGIRFDVSAILLTLIPLFLFTLLPLPSSVSAHKAYKGLLWICFVPTQAFFIGLNLADTEYFPFTGTRSSRNVFMLGKDMTDQAAQLFVQYWHVFFVSFVAFFVFAKLFRFLAEQVENESATHLKKAVTLIFIIPILVLGVRGGFQRKPLNTVNAYVFLSPSLNALALNSTFTFLKAPVKSSLQRVQHLSEESPLLKEMSATHQEIDRISPSFSGQNVVVIILESFGMEYLAHSKGSTGEITPFLNSLAKNSVFFQNNFANGRRSIDAVPSILASIPSLMDEPFVTSAYQGNRIYGMGEAFRSQGYETVFYHGGKNGTMYFDVFSKMAGFEQYIGMNEYPKEKRKQDFDGTWGIFDEPFLKYSVKHMSSLKRPFLSTIFTLSSHNPYTIPKEYAGKFPKGLHPMHESIAYADYALAQFFQKASQEDWYQDTLFVLTSDHTALNFDPDFKGELNAYRVPLIFYHPSRPLPEVQPKRVTQHADILPSLLHLFDITPEIRSPFGHSVFDTKFPGRAINYSAGSYLFIKPDVWATGNKLGLLRLFKNEPTFGRFEEVAEPSLKDNTSLEFKALIQVFNNRLIDNKLRPH